MSLLFKLSVYKHQHLPFAARGSEQNLTLRGYCFQVGHVLSQNVLSRVKLLQSLLWLVRLLSSMPFKDVNEVTGLRAPEVGSLFAAAPSWELSCLLQRTGAD